MYEIYFWRGLEVDLLYLVGFHNRLAVIRTRFYNEEYLVYVKDIIPSEGCTMRITQTDALHFN